MHVGFRAIQFAEQDRRRVDRIAGMDEVLGGADRQVVHHFQPGRDTGTDQVGHRPPGAFHIVEALASRTFATGERGNPALTVTSTTTPSSARSR